MRLLIVDDEKMICEEFRETLEQDGHQVDCARSGKEGLKKIQTENYNVIFLDAAMPSLSGEEVLKKIRTFSQVPVAIISGFLSSTREKEILQQGAIACLRKPLDLDQVKFLLRSVESRSRVY